MSLSQLSDPDNNRGFIKPLAVIPSWNNNRDFLKPFAVIQLALDNNRDFTSHSHVPHVKSSSARPSALPIHPPWVITQTSCPSALPLEDNTTTQIIHTKGRDIENAPMQALPIGNMPTTHA